MFKTLVSLCLISLSLSAFDYASDKGNITAIDSLITLREYQEAHQLVDSLLADQQFQSRRKINNHLLQKKADILYYLNDNEQSVEYYLKSASQENLREDRDLSLIIESYGNAAYCLIQLGLFEKAIRYSQLAYQSAFEIGDSVEMAMNTANIGVSYKRLGNYNSALVHFEEAYVLDKAMNDRIGMAYDLDAIAVFFTEWGKLDQALKYYQESLAIMAKANLKKEMAVRYGNIASLYLEKENLIQAERNISKAIVIDKELSDSLALAKHLNLLGRITVKNKRPKAAIALHYQALEIFSRFNAIRRIAICNRDLAGAYFLANQDNLAVARLDSAINLAEGNDFLQELVSLYSLKIEYLKTIESSDEISILEERVDILKDSMFSMENSNQLHKLELTNELSKKEEEIEKMRQITLLEMESVEATHTKQLIWIAIGLCMVIVLVYMMVRFKQKSKRLAYQLEIDTLQGKVNALLQDDPDNFNIKLNDVNEQLSDPLSDREFQILKYTFTKKSNLEIAEELELSVNTIKFHFKNIFKKIGVKNRKEVLRFLLAA